MANAVNLGGSCFCIITGASQGIGRSLTIECAQRMGPSSLLVLIARNNEGLQVTKSLAETSDVKVIIKSIDLSTVTKNAIEKMFTEILTEFDARKFDTNIIFHNAGSVGDITLSAEQLDDTLKWQEYYNLNVFNVAMLNCVFLDKLKSYEERNVVVNITSLCGIKPFAGMPLYCSGKAAREMYFRVLAEEKPNLKVFNYSPGPVRTAMVQTIITNTPNVSLKESFVTYDSENKLLEPDQTAKRCLEILCSGNYKSGEHVDYFDEI